MATIKIEKQLKCLRCSHEWNPIQTEVRICPKCKSAWWDKPKMNRTDRINQAIQKNQLKHDEVRKKWVDSKHTDFKPARRMSELEDRHFKIREIQKKHATKSR